MAAEDIFKKAAQMISETNKEKEEKKKLLEEDRRALIDQMGKEMERVVAPMMAAMVENTKTTLQEMRDKLTISVEAPQIPELKIPEIRVPQPKVSVSVPEIKSPAINIPKTEINFPEEMRVSMPEIDAKRPLPVMMMDVKGKPMQFPVGASGGKADYLTIKGFSQSAYSELTNADGRLKVSVETGGSGLTDTELRATAVPVSQLSGASWSTNVVSAFGSTAVDSVFNADNRVRVSVETGGSGLTDSELRATAVPVSQVSGANWSTEVTNTVTADVTGQGDVPITLDSEEVTVNPGSTFGVDQVSGSRWSTLARPIQVRGSLTTAYATLADSSEDTLIAASSGNYLDLIEVMCANTSDAAQTVHLRDVSGGNIVSSIVIPAESTAGIANTVPLPQSNIGNAWTVQNAGSDLSNTTIYVTAKFSQET